MPTPEGWRTETIAFPLDFAPELDYDGIEELRFAPGMFTEGSEDFWTYAFVWWVPSDTPFDSEILKADLEAYFLGLTKVVADAKGYDPGSPDIRVNVRGVQMGEKGNPVFEGTVDTYDPFVTRNMLELNLRVEVLTCGAEARKAIFFELSPQPESHTVWKSLEEIRDGFRCSR
jgi:hypothetical protein